MNTDRLPPLNSLKAFEAAARHESFLEAAAEQGVTSGSISRHVRLLESYLGTELFVRRSNGVTLTSAGKEYAGKVSGILRDLRTATDRVRKPSRERAIVISTLPIFSERWLYRRIPSFRKAFDRAEAADRGSQRRARRGSRRRGCVDSVFERTASRHWFAVELVADREYQIDLRGSPTGDGTLSDPYLRGIHDAEGTLISGTTNDDGGAGYNSRVTFTASETGTYYIAAGAFGRLGTYELEVRDVSPQTAQQETVNDPPVFDYQGYAFTLAENTDGSANRVSLGTVTATDPDDDPVAYSIEGGNAPGLFEIDAQTGELFYVGAGEDYESETRKYELTVRANDGSLYRDVTVIVNVTDVVEEYVSLQQQARVSEPVGEDLPADTSTTGAVAVGGSAGGRIESDGDRDWFAVELVAGRSYRIDLEGSGSGSGVLRDSYLYGIHDAAGDLIAYTTDDDGGEGLNSRVYFTAEETGTYYVAAGAYGTRQGAYRLSVADVTDTYTDDFAVGTGTSGVVEVDGSARGEIEFSGDRDWFAVELVADREYRIDLKGLWTGDGTLGDPYLRGIHDANGVLIPGTENDDSGFQYNSRVMFTPTSDGTYYVVAGAVGEGEGAYTLSVADRDDFADGTRTTGSVRVGGSVRGRIDDLYDSDWFRVTLVAGMSYQIDLKGRDTGHGTLPAPYLGGIHDENGDLIAGTEYGDGGAGNNNARGTFTPMNSGAYYVVADGGGDPGDIGTYTLSVSYGDDYAADNSTTGTVAVGVLATGEIEFDGDRDWFAIELETGRTYRIDLNGSSTGDGTLPDPWLVGIHNEDGELIEYTTNDDGGAGFNSQVYFTAEETGTYYAAAGTSQDGGVGSYKLSVTDVDDFVARTWTTGTVAVGVLATGEIEFDGDRDWFAVELEAGQTYRIDLEGSDTGGGTLPDPWLVGIHNEGGDLIVGTTDDDGGAGLNSLVYFAPDDAGTYYVAAGASQDGGVGSYKLSVTAITDDYAADNSTTGTVAVGGSARGRINDQFDSDWFRVTLVAGMSYQIDLKGRDTGHGTLPAPYLYGIHDENGDLIAGTEYGDGGAGNNNARGTFTPMNSGAYYVVADGGGDPGDIGTYTLSVSYGDDYAADNSTAGAVAVGGSVTSEIHYENDRDWFAVTLVAGGTYRIDLEGTGAEALNDPYLHGVYDADGGHIVHTWDDDSGVGRNSRVRFRVEEGGTYYVAAGASGIKTGTYTLSVIYELSVTDVDDFLTHGSDLGALVLGVPARDRIESNYDRDYFAVTLEAGRRYQIDLIGVMPRATSGDGMLLYPYLYGVHDSTGSLISDTTDEDNDNPRNSRVTFTAEETGTYYVVAGPRDHFGQKRGAYELTVTDFGDRVVADFEDGRGTSGAVAANGSVWGEIGHLGDRDWFAVELEAGKTYQIDLERSGADPLGNPYLYGIHDSTGGLIDGTTNDNGGQGRNSRVLFTAEEAGTYYVAAGAAGNGEGTYTLSVLDLTIGVETSRRVTVDGSARGEVDYVYDRDWFEVTLEAGKSYRIEIEGYSFQQGTLRKPYLYGIHDADGDLIAHTRGSHGGSGFDRGRVTFEPEEAGTYYVEVGATGGKVGTYTVSVTDLTDDYAAGTGTTGVVAVGSPVSGEIDYEGERDWFAVELEAGTTYRIDLEGRWTGGGTLSDPYLRGIHRANGNHIAGTTDDDGGASHNSRVTFTAEEAGTYYVAAGAWGTREGTYTLSVDEVM